MNSNVGEAAAALREAISLASRGLIEREALVELIGLAAVAQEHVLVIGPPGTAKSEAVRRFSRALGGRYFEYLLGRFTEPSEVFGPIDIRRLREGVFESRTSGMLPEAEVAFLDEVFQGSTAILNALLGILNERLFRRGHTELSCPLRVCIGASNALPDDESLAAFADRFLIRAFVEPIPDPRLEELLEGGWQAGSVESVVSASIEHIDVLADAALRADLAPVRERLAQAIRILRRAGVALSDRRIVKSQKLIAAAAVLAGREAPDEADLWPVVLCVPTAEGQSTARDCLRDLLAAAHNPTLPVAAEDATLGPLARAARIAAAGREELERRPPDVDLAGIESWQLRLEGIAREIDAGFASDDLPEELDEVRNRIVAELAASEASEAETGAPLGPA